MTATKYTKTARLAHRYGFSLRAWEIDADEWIAASFDRQPVPAKTAAAARLARKLAHPDVTIVAGTAQSPDAGEDVYAQPVVIARMPGAPFAIYRFIG